jgi:ABC-type glycerol-3-phosphate transport system permease component
MTYWSLTKSALFYLAVAAIVFFSVFPFYYAVITSFATGADLFRVQYWPHSLITAERVDRHQDGRWRARVFGWPRAAQVPERRIVEPLPLPSMRSPGAGSVAARRPACLSALLYRAASFAGRLYDRLEREFGRDPLFMDVDTTQRFLLGPGEQTLSKPSASGSTNRRSFRSARQSRVGNSVEGDNA